MDLATLIQPITVEDFRSKFFGKQCFVIKRKHNPLEGLLSLDEVEARLNDGVASLTGLSIIKPDGVKIPASELRTAQTGQAWTQSFAQKTRIKSLLHEGCSFVMHNMSAISPRVEGLVADIERTFEGSQADVHVYVSPTARATGYNAHRDQPQHKIYIQLMGSTQWVVFKGTDPRTAMPIEEARRTLTVDFEVTLTPGSVLYMPPAVFHHATNPESPRVSLSIPFYPSPSAVPIDRTRISLDALRG